MIRDYEHSLYAQGYLLHRPMTVGNLVTTVQGDRMTGALSAVS
jgi:hypothetical protein